MTKNYKIIVATHKQFTMPADTDLYLPIHVGSEGKEKLGYQCDNEGDNISSLNPYYCELTGLYWAWKNLECDYIGLVHYRRYFTAKRHSYSETIDMNDIILSKAELQDLDNRPPYMREAYELIAKKYGPGKARELFKTNPSKIINDQLI